MIAWLQAHAVSLFIAIVYGLAAISAARAILYTRTAQGAMAWVLALILMPFLTLPFYWVFGRTRFHGYVTRRQRIMEQASARLDPLEALNESEQAPEGAFAEVHTMARRLGTGGFLSGNKLTLLVDGPATFDAMLTEIASAQRFILIQFYIFRDDDIGRKFQRALIERAGAGVSVYFLYDEVGSRLPWGFMAAFDKAGVHYRRFDPGRKSGNRLQINFRNHRKIVVVDGAVAFVGGLNVGDDYLGLYPKVGRWRDTHLRIEGPCAAQAQIAFLKDWYWAADHLPKTGLPVRRCPMSDSLALVWHTGPADPQPECQLGWLELINATRERLWIANPYFVPPEPILEALRLALLRGVEVKLLLPGWSDNRLVALASRVPQADLANCGAQIYRWRDGFMHQKVCLADNGLAMIGTTNLDHRSIFINFEIAVMSTDARLIGDVERMLEVDFAHSERISLDEYRNARYWEKLACRAANLCSPML
jgi:cardiolipin synthase